MSQPQPSRPRKRRADALPKPVPKRTDASADTPAAGPHATAEQTLPDATPDAGVLPDNEPGLDVDPGAG